MAHSRLRTRLLLLLLAVTGGRAAAQEMQPASESIPGTEHWVAFMGNAEPALGAPSKFLGLYISSQVSTTGFVEIPGKQGVTPFSVERGQMVTIPLPSTLELFTSEEVNKAGVRVWSRAPVSVYAYNARNTSGAGFTARPLSTWGTSYSILTLPNGKTERSGEFLVVAAYDTTRITIQLSSATHYRNGGEVIQKTLNRGETYLVKADPLNVDGDLTGTLITGNHPFEVISGHVRAGVGDGVSGGANVEPLSHLATMLTPIEQVGTEYVSTPLRSTGDRFRILPLELDTRIEFTQYRPDGTDREEKVLGSEALDISSISGRAITAPVHWKANKPFAIIQLRKSAQGIDGMPAMINLVPVDRFSPRATFGIPAQLGDQSFAGQTLTVIARAESQDALKGIVLDGKPLHELAPSLLTRRLGGTNLYTATVALNAGSHTILSNAGATFSGVTSGATTTGNPADYYVNVLPTWLPQIGLDVTAPRLLSAPTSPRRGRLEVVVTDATPDYFSGVSSVEIVNSPGWHLEQFDTPSPDDDAVARFTATTDPSGPLYAKLTDRDGNTTTVKLSDGVCFKTATANRQSVEMSIETGRTATEAVALVSNPCGDAATVLWVNEGNGTARGLIDLAFTSGPTPVSIPAGGGQATLNINIDASMVSPGTYSTVVSVGIDDSTVMIPVTITVNAPSAVAMENEADESLLSALYPNPVRDGATIALGRDLGRKGSVTITDRLGRLVSDLSPEAAGSRRTLRWNGLDQQGAPVPAGTYFLTIADGAARLVRGITVIR